MAIAMQELPKPIAGTLAHPYEGDGVYDAWWRHLSSHLDTTYRQLDLLIYRKKMLKGLLFFKESRIAGWDHAGFQDLSENQARQLIDLQQRHGWDVFRMTWDVTREQPFEIFQKAGYQLIELEKDPQYLMDLRGGYETYLKSLGHDGRKELRKKVRRAQALNPTFIAVEHEADIEPFFDEICKYHIPYWLQKTGRSYLNFPEERAFNIARATAFHRSGQLCMERLMMGGETVNLSVGMYCGKTFHGLITINTGLHQDYGPGLVGLAMRMERLAGQGVEFVNLGSGGLLYKSQSSNLQTPRKEILILNPESLKARLYQRWILRKHETARLL